MKLKKLKTTTILLLISLFWLIVTSAGDMGVIDTDLRLNMAHAWWTGTDEVQVQPGTPIKVRGDIRFGVEGVQGKRYIAYEEGQSLLMVPGDWLGTQVSQLFPSIAEQDWRQIVTSFFVFIPLNMAAVLTVYWFLTLFEFTERVSALSSLLFMMGTTFLHYSQVHQHNNQILLLITVAYGTALAYVKTEQPRYAFLCGLAVGGSILLRITSILHGITVFIFLLSALFYKSHRGSAIAIAAYRWLIGLIPFTLLGRVFAYIRYGNPFLSAKKVEQLQLATDPLWTGMPQLPANYPLINSPFIGILGPLLNPAKSIFIYDPLLLPCVFLAIRLWKKMSPFVRIYLVLNLLNLIMHLMTYSRFVFWHGDSAWGSRYHVTSVQLLLIPLLGYFVEILQVSKDWLQWAMRCLIAIAIVVQLGSASMDYNLELMQKQIGIPGSQYDLRIASRLNNILCYVNPNVNQYCFENYPKQRQILSRLNYIRFFPFNYQQKYEHNSAANLLINSFFVFWLIALLLAIFFTVTYIFFYN